MRRSRLSRPLTVLALTLLSLPARGQEGGSVVSDKGITAGGDRFRLQAEIKVNYRGSHPEEVRFNAAGVPFPLVMRPPSSHGSVELSNVALIGEATLTPDISGKVQIHFIDLYNRNPSSSDDRVFVREAWLRFGRKVDVLREPAGTSVYLQLGKSPRFSKQLNRRFESYGLWGTAVGRFEETGVEAGGTFGKHVYWRASAVSGNPVFFRDTNALAGDNGTPERTADSTQPVVYESGFPILYDAKTNDVALNGKLQCGGGLGFKLNWGEGGRDGVDVLLWAFRREMAERASIRGSFYSGEIELLRGFAPANVSLPIDGNEKREFGANLEARFGAFQLYGQYVWQEIAGLRRKGYEVEGAWRFRLNGLFVSGDSPVINWIQPTVRVSVINNDWANPPGFVAPSISWPWAKYDFGFRLGVVRGVDLTAEYARHEARARTRIVSNDELLVTLRAAF